MDRREFSRAIGLGIVGAQIFTDFAGAKDLGATHKKVPASSRKAWSLEHFKGLENVLVPSYTADFRQVDEAGIRRDVRLAIEQGFFATACGQYTVGLTKNEQKRFVEIACSEAGDKIQVGTMIVEPLDSAIELAAHAEKSGCSHMLLISPPNLYKGSEDELYSYYARVAETTSLAVVLEYYDDQLSRKWHPAGMSLKVYDRLADIPNIVAMKLTQTTNPATAFELSELLGSRILLGPVNLDLVPLLTKHCRLQWAGMFAADCVQAPDKRYAVEFMRLMNSGKYEEAMKAYWQFQPANQAFYDLQAPALALGGHPWTHIKYYEWLIGGNGGLVRDVSRGENAGLLKKVDETSMPILDSQSRQRIKNVFRGMGVTIEDRPEEEFLVGREAYAAGVRAADLKYRFGYA